MEPYRHPLRSVQGHGGLLIGYLFTVGWLSFLVFPIEELFRARTYRGEVGGSLAGVIGFVAIYLWFWVRFRMAPAPIPPRSGLYCLGGVLLIATLLSLANAGRWFTIYIYVVVVAGAAFRMRLAVVAIGAVTAIALAVAFISRAPGDQVSAITIELVLLGFSSASITRLMETNHDLRRAREEVARLAVAEERLRFARDLHDLLGHSLSVIVLKAELARRLGDRAPDRVAAEIADIERVARDALREVRDAVSGYRQPTLDQELEGTRSVLVSAGIQAGFRRDSDDLPASLETVLAWVVREGVTNVIRHSRASNCSVVIEPEQGGVRLTVEDDGRGCADLNPGSGLRGLRERVEGRDGRLEAGPRPEGGFRLVAWLPLAETRARALTPA